VLLWIYKLIQIPQKTLIFSNPLFAKSITKIRTLYRNKFCFVFIDTNTPFTHVWSCTQQSLKVSEEPHLIQHLQYPWHPWYSKIFSFEGNFHFRDYKMLTRISQLNKMVGWSLCSDLPGSTKPSQKNKKGHLLKLWPHREHLLQYPFQQLYKEFTTHCFSFKHKFLRDHDKSDYCFQPEHLQVNLSGPWCWLGFPLLALTFSFTAILKYSRLSQIMTLSICCSCMRLRRKNCVQIFLFFRPSRRIWWNVSRLMCNWSISRLGSSDGLWPPVHDWSQSLLPYTPWPSSRSSHFSLNLLYHSKMYTWQLYFHEQLKAFLCLSVAVFSSLKLNSDTCSLLHDNKEKHISTCGAAVDEIWLS